MPAESSMKVKDHWKISGDKVIRIHITPRVAMFSPAGTQCPIPVERLLPVRKVNMVRVHDKGKESINDDWTDKKVAHRKMPNRWIGETIFMKQNINPREIEIYSII